MSVRSCMQYALSHIILKSLAAGFNAAKRLTVSSEYVMPSGFEYLGTHQIPLTVESFSTYFSTISISGPFSVIGIVIISIFLKKPVTPKCLSYPGAGQRNLIFPWRSQGCSPATPFSEKQAIVSNIILRLELPPMNTFSGLTPSICAKSSLASSIPSRIP